MPAGDAGLERQPVDTAAIRQRLAEAGDLTRDYGHTIHVDGEAPLAQAVLDLAKSVPLLLAEIERLRAAVSEYFDILEAQQREILGDDAQGIIEEMEQSTTGTRRLAEARRTVYALLGRTAQAAQPEGERA